MEDTVKDFDLAPNTFKMQTVHTHLILAMIKQRDCLFQLNEMKRFPCAGLVFS